MYQRNIIVLAEEGGHLTRLVLAQQAGVDEDAGELRPDRLMDQHRRDGRIHPAGQATDNLRVADLSPDPCDLFVAVGRHGPVAGQTRHAMSEVPEQGRPPWGVHHLGMELDAIDLPLFVGDCRERRAFRGRDSLEAGG